MKFKKFLKNPFKRSKVKRPVYRASRSGKLRSRSPVGELYFADTPRTKEFGPIITKAFINISKPFQFLSDEIEDVTDHINNKEAIKIFNSIGVDAREEMEYRGLKEPIELLQDYLDSSADYDVYQHPIILKAIKKSGYDGIITQDTFGGKAEYVVFSPKQIYRIEEGKKLGDYLTETYYIYFKKRMKGGQEYSDHEEYRNKKEALKAINAYKKGYNIGDDVEDFYYWDDEGNSWTIVSNGKLNKKRAT